MSAKYYLDNADRALESGAGYHPSLNIYTYSFSMLKREW
jgi:hypothetical protein